MTFSKLSIEGAYLIQDKVFKDERGAFTEIWATKQLRNAGISFQPASSCFSFNIDSGILRGLHYQSEPFGQSKIVSCVAGKVYDVILDLRKGKSSFLKWEAIGLTAFSGQAIYIPEGCAHGFVTLENNTVISYLIEGEYNPQAAGVVRWNDPSIGISWPVKDPILSEKDRNAADFIK
jgi:dTDP-4-dehydrorhamnose 3,5-epimerase